jgi:aminoglycoside phosphotransferase (APT) family kinase protein
VGRARHPGDPGAGRVSPAPAGGYELATVGDPLSDVGYVLVGLREQATVEAPSLPAASPAAARGFVTRDEFAAEYARRSGRSVDHIEFHVLMACFKLAVNMELTNARFLAGATVGDGFEGLAERARTMAAATLAIADGASDPRLRGIT